MGRSRPQHGIQLNRPWYGQPCFSRNPALTEGFSGASCIRSRADGTFDPPSKNFDMFSRKGLVSLKEERSSFSSSLPWLLALVVGLFRILQIQRTSHKMLQPRSNCTRKEANGWWWMKEREERKNNRDRERL